jgi:4-amino-4-deoxy-L-arabinose transferase-like glycosyltransferase
VRRAPSTPASTRTSISSRAETQRATIKPTTIRRIQQEPEFENGQIILHRSPNFSVRTTNRPGAINRGPTRNPLRLRSGDTTLLPSIAGVPLTRTLVAESDTRLMPNVEPINPIKTSTIHIPAWAEALMVALSLAASFATHAFNLFSFPHYELDEGTYMASAWSIVHGMITPYPYGYGHPPVGWIQIAAWVQLTGGFFAFGNAINSGRVLMLLFALGSSLLVYGILRRLDGSRGAALLAMLIFSLSPLGIVYQRQVYLDNIGTFWLLLSLYLLVISNSRLLYIVLAALSFGLAILSKEIFVLFIPAMIYAVWLHTTAFQRKFALVAFTYTVISMGSSFVLMAVLKGELLPAGLLPWDHHPHLSMLDTFFQQTQRSQSEGSFQVSWLEWTQTDFLLIAFSIFATLFNLIAGWWNRKLLLLALFAISFWVLLLRGGVVFPFYLIPMIPLAALNAAMAVHTIMSWISKYLGASPAVAVARLLSFDLADREVDARASLQGRIPSFIAPISDLLRVVLLFGVIVAISSYDIQHLINYVPQRPATAQVDALLWIRNHVPHNAVLVINSYFYTDLHEPGGEGVGNGATYPFAHIYWNLAYDPELHDGLLKNDWNRIDYIVISDPTMQNDIRTRGGNMAIIDQALHNSVLLADFQAQDRNQHLDIQIYQVVHRRNI